MAALAHALLLAALCAGVAACADGPGARPPSPPAVTVPPPRGWIDYCTRHRQDDPACSTATTTPAPR